MVVQTLVAWKLLFAAALATTIFLSACAKAPRRTLPGRALRRLVAAALSLYGIGAVASLTHHSTLAVATYAVGIVVCALAAWLSRGSDSQWPPRGQEPADDSPPPDPDAPPEFDWAAFERAFRDYSNRERVPAGRS